MPKVATKKKLHKSAQPVTKTNSKIFKEKYIAPKETAKAAKARVAEALAVAPVQIDIEDAIAAAPAPIAKRRDSSRAEKFEPVDKGKLGPVFNGWPRINPYNLDVRALDGIRIAYHNFASCYVAKKFLEVAAPGQVWTLVKHEGQDAIQVGRRWLVLGNHAKDIFEHAYSKAEAAFTLPSPVDGYAAALGGLQHPLQARIAERTASLEAGAATSAPSAARPARATPGGEARQALARVASPPRGKLAMTAIITVLTAGNPCKAGSKSALIFACFKTGQTVEEFIKLGQAGWDMKGAVGYFEKRGNISVKGE